MSLGLIALATFAGAETITFETDENILIVRGRQAGEDARYEFLANGEDRLQCIALDSDGNPLAVENTYANSGYIRFDDLTIEAVDEVVCRENNYR